MARRRTFALSLALGVAGVASSAGLTVPPLLTACTELPGKTCFGDRVNVYKETDAGPDPGCTSCLQTPACCDLVGRCDDDPACVDNFRATHACVIDGGPADEDRCRTKLTNDDSRALYDCMRSHCGATCGVPDCTIDKEVVLLEDPTCDRCLGGSCCKPINDCYGDRRCKLVIECISEHCPNTFGSSLTAFGALPQNLISQAVDKVCGGQAPPVELPACLHRCLDEVAPDIGTDGGSAADQQSRCSAFKVFACGAEAKCGPACSLPEGGSSFVGPYPEDLSPRGTRGTRETRETRAMRETRGGSSRCETAAWRSPPVRVP